MYIVTNRFIKSRGKGLNVIGDMPNEKGPNELRLINVEKIRNSYSVEVVKDKMDRAEVRSLKKKYALDINEGDDHYASLKVACELFDRAVVESKSILFYVHGYNNDVKDIIKTAYQLEALYDVIVVPYSWPANGGGALSGTASYLSDKRDARTSADAFNRFVEKIHAFHQLLTAGSRASILAKVEKKYSGRSNPEAAAALCTKLIKEHCSVGFSLLCHSMGNYLLKRSLTTSETVLNNLIFDNICMVAPDVNIQNHRDWVGNLDVRGDVYICINENDFALGASRVKPGAEQKARLGHSLKGLNSDNATYINVSDANGVGNEHSYFKDDPVKHNAPLKEFFSLSFNGKPAKQLLDYQSGKNVCVLRGSIFRD